MWGLKMQWSRFSGSVGMALARGALSLPAAAQEVVLKGVAAFQEGSIYAQKFEQYIKAVNEKGKGQIRIQYLGGAPKVMPLFDVGKNLKDGVIDIVTTSSAYYGNVLPEAEAMKLIEVSMAELRSNGGLAFLNKLHVEKANTEFLARFYNYERAHIFLNKEITKPDFSGLKIRVTPMYRPMVEKLGGTGINSTPPEVYTMLERNTVDGYGWAHARHLRLLVAEGDEVPRRSGLLSPRHHAAGQPRHLDQEAERCPAQAAARPRDGDRGQHRRRRPDRGRAQEAGRKPASRRSASRRPMSSAISKEAREAGWAVVNKISPENGPKLRSYFTKE